MSLGIANKVIVITGTSSGLGAKTARYLPQLDAKVALGALRLERLENLVSELGVDTELTATITGENEILFRPTVQVYKYTRH